MLKYFNLNKTLLTINRLRKFIFAIFITVHHHQHRHQYHFWLNCVDVSQTCATIPLKRLRGMCGFMKPCSKSVSLPRAS